MKVYCKQTQITWVATTIFEKQTSLQQNENTLNLMKMLLSLYLHVKCLLESCKLNFLSCPVKYSKLELQ